MKTPIALVKKPASEDLIKVLEEALQLAKAGTLTGIVVVGTGSGQTHVNWAGTWSAPEVSWCLDLFKHEAIAAALEKGK